MHVPKASAALAAVVLVMAVTLVVAAAAAAATAAAATAAATPAKGRWDYQEDGALGRNLESLTGSRSHLLIDGTLAGGSWDTTLYLVILLEWAMQGPATGSRQCDRRDFP